MFVPNTLALRVASSALVLLAALARPASGLAAQEAHAVDVVELTAEDVVQGYAEGRFTVTQVIRAFLARIETYEERYNAFISMNPEALAEAEALDVELAGGSIRGPLHGVPVVVKDNIDMAGLVTTAGWDGFSSAHGGVDMVPQDDAAFVERLRAAGAVILGKTNLPDFAGHGTRTGSSVAGVTLNPYNVDKAPGGSSGGTATAVAASFAVLGIGTETGGSIQNPSAAQALVGVKPTYGLVPLEGVVPLSGSYVDVAGPIAKTVMDAALTLDVLAGPTHEDLATFAATDHIPDRGYVAALRRGALEGKRFGLVGPGWRERFLPLAPETENRYREAIATVESLGAETVEDPFAGSGFVEMWDAREGASTGA
ncbi:MAG: amidase, partial [Gemmatimonadetes bacterium]|nr:amidase [Gemmatimonadota bacterium]